MKRKSVLLDQATIDRLLALGAATDRSFSYVVRQMVLSRIDEMESQADEHTGI